MILSLVWEGTRPAWHGFRKRERPLLPERPHSVCLYEHECLLPPGYAGSHHMKEMCAFVFMR